MTTISIRIDRKLKDNLMQLAKKNRESISQSLRRLIEDGLAIASHMDQNTETTKNNLFQEQQKLATEYKRNFDFVMLETCTLFRLMVRESGKFFTPDEISNLLLKAQQKTEIYMIKFYGKDWRETYTL